MPSPLDDHPKPNPASAAGAEPAAPVTGAVDVEVRDLTIVLGERVLLEGTAARFEAGQVTLIVGVSGAGKTTLLRVLAGLLDPAEAGVCVSGRVEFGGLEVPERARCRRVGVVFQDPALFDELSPTDNVRLALAHRAPRSRREQVTTAGALLNELQVPTDVRTASLSGGQRQRLAIARTLAYDPDVILYDEPTAGLDAVTAAQVANLIRATQTTHPKTSIVVTHDYQALAPIADRIYFLDPQTRTLREIQRADWPHLQTQLKPVELDPTAGTGSAPRGLGGGPGRRGVLRGLVTRCGDFLAGTADVAANVVLTPLALVPLWRSPYWGLRFLLHYLQLVAGPSAWAYLAVSGMIVGFINTHFIFQYLPFPQYTKPLLIEDLLIALGFALYRIFVPVLATILVAARCGAAVAADVGGKSYGHQIDALRTLGVHPRRYLLTPILYSFLIGTPLLTFLAYWAASTTSLVVFTVTHPAEGPDFWDLHFHQRLVSPDAYFLLGTWWVLAKVLLSAAGTAAIAYHLGIRRKHSTRDVSNSLTATILWATLFVLVVHFAFAFCEFERDRLDVLWAVP